MMTEVIKMIMVTVTCVLFFIIVTIIIVVHQYCCCHNNVAAAVADFLDSYQEKILVLDCEPCIWCWELESGRFIFIIACTVCVCVGERETHPQKH
jgi:hypothetical protein